MNDSGIFYPDPKWYEARIGLVTSSKVHDAITKRKRGEGDLAARRNLKLQMLSEIATQMTTEHYVSQAMDWGVENEPRARAEYEYRTGKDVTPVGLLLHPTNPRAGATPDGFINPNGLLEIKCPETWNHFEYLAGGEIPSEYLDQIDWQMACAGPEIEWVDFVSFDPRIEDDDLKLFICRRERNNERIAEMEDLVGEFLRETIQLYEQIKRGKQTLEDKLRASIKQAGKYDPDLVAAFNEDFVP